MEPWPTHPTPLRREERREPFNPFTHEPRAVTHVIVRALDSHPKTILVVQGP
jgi:hypothetical protein